MEAGRELDALVAEKVFGDKPSESPTEDSLWLIRRGSENGGWLRSITGSDPQDCNLMVVDWLPKAFSTEIASAWAVVEKMQERGFNYHVESGDAGCLVDVFFDTDHESPIFFADADTAPHAICLAALAAMSPGGSTSAVRTTTTEHTTSVTCNANAGADPVKRSRLRSRSQLKRGKPLKRSGSPKRKTRLHARGGSMFPLTAEDKAQWKWMKQFTEVLGPCDCECGLWGYRHRAHLIPRSRTGMVLDNIVLLIPAHHDEQEKATLAFCIHRNVDLYKKAAAHTAQWRKET